LKKVAKFWKAHFFALFREEKMQNKQALLDLVARAERGVLLPGEAQILREAIELLDDMTMTLNQMTGGTLANNGFFRGYDPSTTQSFRLFQDDDAPGRP
jgi:hypothetical protein